MYIHVRGMCGKTLVGRDHTGTEILMSVSQPMKRLNFGRGANQRILLHYVCYRSYHGKKTSEFCWVAARGYISVVCSSFVH